MIVIEYIYCTYSLKGIYINVRVPSTLPSISCLIDFILEHDNFSYFKLPKNQRIVHAQLSD